MPFTNFNPPFTNQNISDFFNFATPNQSKVIFLNDWIFENFPDLSCKLAYHAPFYWLGKNKIMYLHYFQKDDALELELSFVKGGMMNDEYRLFQAKNKQTKAIWINSVDEIFLQKLKYYIRQAINLS
jgi:hypothetical protein